MDPAVPRIVVASFRSPEEVAVARSAIEAAGIEVSLISDPTGIGIAVAAEHADEAVALLSEVWPEPKQLPVEVVPVEVERCPECGSTDLLRIRRLPFFIIFMTVMVTIGYAVGQSDLFALLVIIVAALLFFGPNRRCTRCGERWRSWSSPPKAPPPPEAAVEPPDVPCPRCGSIETTHLYRRRQKALTLLVHFVLPPLLLVWPFLPTRRCEECGHEFR